MGVSSHARLAFNRRLFISFISLFISCVTLGLIPLSMLGGEGPRPGSLDGPGGDGSGILTARGGVPGKDLVSSERSSSLLSVVMGVHRATSSTLGTSAWTGTETGTGTSGSM